MYYYAYLDENNICVSLHAMPNDDLSNSMSYVPIGEDTYNSGSPLGKRWDAENLTWENAGGYYYAVIKVNGVCIDVVFTDSASTNPNYISIETMNRSYIGKWYDRSTSTWSDDVPFELLATHNTDEINVSEENISLTNKLNNMESSMFIVGEVKWLATNDQPDGWIVCDGSAISRVDYERLFTAIGTVWGEGDGSDTFNLPNLMNKTVWGGYAPGGYKEAGLPDHTHSYSSFPRHGATPLTTLSTARWCDGVDSTASEKITGTFTNASASDPIYGKSTTVQPPAAILRPFIKY